MFIAKCGDPKKSAAPYRFSCDNCGCEWTAERKEVNITPPCLPYEVYMKCPNCKQRVEAMNYEKRESTRKQKKEAWEYEYERMKESGLC